MNRRDLLKSLMASAGIAAAGFPVVASATPAVAETLPNVSAGEIYVSLNGEWKFIGAARRISMSREMVDAIKFPPTEYREFEAGPEIRMSADMVYLPESQSVIDELFATNDPREFVFGTPSGQFKRSAHVMEFGTTAERNNLTMAEIGFLLA